MSGPLSTLILAAGEGTRMRSSTPKVLHPIAGRPLVEHAVRAAAGLNPEHLVVVIGHGREAVGAELARVGEALGREVTTAVQAEQKGTGHAVSCALHELPAGLTGTVLVSYGDVPLLDTGTLAALLAEHTGSGNAVTVLTAVVENPAGYGRIVRDAGGRVSSIVEHKDATPEQHEITEINSGVYAFDAAVLSDGLSRLSTDNAQGELYLTDVLGIAHHDGKGVGALVVDDPWVTEGVNDRVQLATLGAEYNRRIVRRWQREGVTVTDPNTTWIGADVTLSRDVTLEPNTQLKGTTSVGEGSLVGPDTTLVNVTVGAGASVVRVHADDSELGDGVKVGPYTYLRPGTKLGAKGKLGAFVETKNAQIGTGTKVPHLTYVGDATVGDHSNIGCSSVFVNYDGVNKHHTVVGSYVRLGADNTLVAPVRIGDGAYSGAGAVIRDDVPPGALALSAGPQRNVEGWAVRRRPGTPAAEAAEAALAASEDTAVSVSEAGNDGESPA
ncbi:bifunctional UDP-N-acetylglucosamine diphosphorylase/glucosamine-1-phosphate N-acetyltransferase GlmU [Amycolatopsis sp. FDAARGOS 1241]|uniref:bifunctional UDP-N-acetylglucosamine diphosphorylase/glucosamine-1-phosphate N-acetyltransferase GlmU n=1 Tax=Amycolatopsis sp. FDAARGOS 1241 TaxID=2778070 RepID=UPI00194E410E|nr:bifunctional UDP-N-acetylglucosamine diphosphorylase/glucosamine-1-phosphate N-acetyltransferase GlmU [Amycolatopsis sp. FDAARGOS 1241]QRP47016.1 bifunctional UDP-N-acetylglucosamine diphosphorylase/glucosamine-1-phosphate N-acetyltransferase GlmU [Amycolatopsis sp. FDAARGOS 1241]